MSFHLPPLRLTGAKVLRDGQLSDRSIALADGRITKGPLPAVDLSGFLVLPGVVDMLALPPLQRQGPRNPAWLLQEADRQGAANGVTTQFVCQGWSWEDPGSTPAAAESLGAAWGHPSQPWLTDLRLMLRVEHGMTPDTARLLAMIQRHKIQSVAFGNRAARALAHQATATDVDLEKLAKRLDHDVESLRLTLDSLDASASQVPRALCQLAEAFDLMGIVYGSIEDASAEDREYHSMLGAALCLTPVSSKAATAAHAVSDPVVLSACDVSEQLRTHTLERAHSLKADALVSNGTSGSLAKLALDLCAAGVMDLPRAWAMISEVPARLMRLTDRGRLDLGCRADITIINTDTGAVEATIANGRLAYLAGEAGARFLSMRHSQTMAAE